MRPKSIVAFEYIELAKLGIGLATTLTQNFFWSLLTFGGLLALVLFISRRASNVAKWIYIGLFLAGLPITVWVWATQPSTILDQPIGQQIMVVVPLLASFVSLWLLLSPATAQWIAASKRESQQPA